MTLLLPRGTDERLSPDEPCWGLREFDERRPEIGLRRIQEVCVLRDQDFFVFEADLGPAEDYHAPPLYVDGGAIRSSGRMEIIHTVGEVMELAEHLREEPVSDRTIEYEETAEKNFLDDLDQALHEGHARKAHRSVFGPEIRIQR